jgi:hypothetical protein
MSNETTVPQAFPHFAHLTITACVLSLRVVDYREKHVARTLSRGFWQQKNFSCSPASRLIRGRQGRFFARIAAADSQLHSGQRDASTLMMNGWHTLARA